MLTKQEREEISKRFGECDDVGFYDIYTAITGKKVPSRTTRDEDFTEISNVILDLCDTSNMVELPLDKDGEVIRAGDTVYDKDGDVAEVGGYYYNNGTCKIIIPYGQNGCYINVFPNELTHKKPVTIASLISEIRRTLSQNTIMNKEATSKLWEITDQIEMLGDSDDD